ncbi:MAG TPA: polyprenyl synthetase family protein, partial [Chloroflexota bacterium]
LSQRALCLPVDGRVDAETVRTIAELFARQGARACSGQQRDLDATGNQLVTEEQYFTTIGLKSGSLVSCICGASAALGSHDPVEINAFSQAGFNLGMVLQILNDVAGILNTPNQRNDLAAWKSTLPLIFALEMGDPLVRAELQTMLASLSTGPLTQTQIERAREIVERTGGLHYARVVSEIYWDRMLNALHEMPQGRAGPLLRFVTSLRSESEGGAHGVGVE